jgi:hypothetical protein
MSTDTSKYRLELDVEAVPQVVPDLMTALRAPMSRYVLRPDPPTSEDLDRLMGWLTDPNGLDWDFIERNE